MLEHPTEGDFVSNGVDLLLGSINRAKDWAQSRYDFERARTSVQLTVDATTGGDLTTAVEIGTGRTVVVKKVEAAFLAYQGTINRPIRLSSKKGQVADAQRRYEGLPYAPTVASPLTAGTGGVSYQMPTLVQQGNTIFLYPNSTALFPQGAPTIYLDVIEWIPNYVDIGDATVAAGPTCAGTFKYYGGLLNGKSIWFNLSGFSLWWNSAVSRWWITTAANTGNTGATARWFLATASPVGVYTAEGAMAGSPAVTGTTNAPSDFLLDFGHEFLMWRSVVEANFVWEQFVFRQEGALAPPEKQLAAAWQALLDWDSGLIATNTSEFDLQ